MTVSRRGFLGSAAAGAAALVPAAGTAQPAHPASAAGAAPEPAYRFFNAPEAAFIEAAVDRLIPPDELGPGAVEAGVPRYLDLQLGGAWGAGERLYRAGPWGEGLPTQGYQLPYTPAELFRTALRAIRADMGRDGGKPFEALPGEAQDAYLTRLQNGEIALDGVPSKVFFESLLAMTIEGYFCDPAYGGNIGMGSWKMIGFPGAYADYYTWVDRHGAAYVAPPRSLAGDSRGHVHLMPNIPAQGTSQGR